MSKDRPIFLSAEEILAAQKNAAEGQPLGNSRRLFLPEDARSVGLNEQSGPHKVNSKIPSDYTVWS